MNQDLSLDFSSYCKKVFILVNSNKLYELV